MTHYFYYLNSHWTISERFPPLIPTGLVPMFLSLIMSSFSISQKLILVCYLFSPFLSEPCQNILIWNFLTYLKLFFYIVYNSVALLTWPCLLNEFPHCCNGVWKILNCSMKLMIFKEYLFFGNTSALHATSLLFSRYKQNIFCINGLSS